MRDDLSEGDEPYDDELVAFLERDQLVTDKSRPLPRAPLTAHASIALWALRVFVILVSAMVIYTFVVQLGN
ncbi:MAG: hypothetical protein ACYDHH_13670 [Solirubrobacteraceae bacterium]